MNNKLKFLSLFFVGFSGNILASELPDFTCLSCAIFGTPLFLPTPLSQFNPEQQVYSETPALSEDADTSANLPTTSKEQYLYNKMILCLIVKRIVELENAGLKDKPLTEQERIAELRVAHNKIIKIPKLLAKFQKNRKVYGTQDTHLSHHGHRNPRIR